MRKPFSQDWPITQKFGENPATYAQFGLKGHNGLDWGTPTGTPILASISGTVIEAVKSGDNGYGKYIKIESDQWGVLTAHLQSVDVEAGQEVQEGQQIGVSDNTGFSTGPHLHFGVFPKPRDRNNGYAGYIDPEPVLEAASEQFLGKPKDYWLQVEKDRDSLLKTEGELKNQAHELGIALDAEKEKSKALDEFVTSLAKLLNVPEDQVEIRKAIAEEVSHHDSVEKLTKEIEQLKNDLIEQTKTASEKAEMILSLTGENDRLTEALHKATTSLNGVEGEYQALLSTIGSPVLKVRVKSLLFAIFKM